MKCPFCTKINNKVVDSRLSKDSHQIRRRRECANCSRRFTTYESVEDIPIMIIKKDGCRQLYIREKLRNGMLRACEKREVSINAMDEFIDELERDLKESEKKEISSREIGERVMTKLQKLDDVAYVRFASVYREFKDINDFFSELKGLLSDK